MPDRLAADRSSPGEGRAELAGQRIIVTGGAGFIGHAVVRALLRRGAAVVVVDRVEARVSGAESIVGDLRDRDLLRGDTLRGVGGFVHLAAATSVLGSVREPALFHETNVEVTARLVELARSHGVERFVMSSTNAVVGDVGETVIHEGLPLRPLSPYGASKAAAEMLLSGYAHSYGIATCALRLTNVYGPGMQHKDGLVPRLMRAALDGSPVQVYGSGRQRRDFVHVDDVVGGLLAAWRARHVGPLIIGTGDAPTVLDVVALVGTVTGVTPRVDHVPPRAGEMPAVVVSTDLAQSLGYRPSVPLAAGLRSVWDDFQRDRAAAGTGL